MPGGGVALLRTISSLDEKEVEGEEKIGINILKRAIEEPIRRIVQNAGIDGAIVVQKVKEGKGGFGFNAETMEYEDLTNSGIIDPTKVVRSALQNAASAVSMFLTIECVVAERKEEKGKEMPPMAGAEY